MCKEHEQYYLNQHYNEEQRRTLLPRALRAVEEDPQNVSKLYELASAYNSDGLFREALEIYRTIYEMAPLFPADPRAIKIVNGVPLERNAQLFIASMLRKLVGSERCQHMPEIEREFLKAIEIQPDCAETVYGQLAAGFHNCRSWTQAIMYYRMLLSAKRNERTYSEYLATCLVELATEESAAKQLPFYQLNALYHEALPLLRRALVDDMDYDKNLELKEYLARALDGVNEREEATAIRNKIERVRQRKEEERRRSELIKRPPPLPEEFQSKFDKLYIEEQQILDCRFGLKAGGSLISVETTARERGQSEEFIRHVEEIALQKLGVDVDYMKSLRAEYRRERYEEEKARRPKGMFIPSPDEERTIDFRPRAK